ncbi:GNAT family N-acetyltransferase [Jeotgalibacillus sp. R-1-5s-1]|uniref:GNAT family N-acetyltransferase n=1 Tax=Jeotgalibacillus sp. R-1-5s-1 TaxID=2555897 RepID=UPI00141B8F06|nr:GNAT family N-acetyltransferase [Jeotgalibacillus sp. R-1-5s-1]
MKELAKHQFELCEPLLRKQGSVEVRAVIEGINEGRVFVDQLDSPSSAVVWLGNLDGFYVIGDEKNEMFNRKLKDFMDLVAGPDALAQGIGIAEILSYHPGWNDVLDEIFSERKSETWEQAVYIYNKKKKPKKALLPPGYEVKYMQEAIHVADYTSRRLIHNKIKEFWSSKESFFEKGIGFCVMKGQQVASVCMTGYRAGNIHAIEIETFMTFEQKGLATAAATAFVEECIAEKMMPYWDCQVENLPSVKTAERTGFIPVFTYRGIEFEFNPQRSFKVNVNR